MACLITLVIVIKHNITESLIWVNKIKLNTILSLPARPRRSDQGVSRPEPFLQHGPGAGYFGGGPHLYQRQYPN